MRHFLLLVGCVAACDDGTSNPGAVADGEARDPDVSLADAELPTDLGENDDLPTLLDPTHATVRATGATISPEAALARLDGSGGFELLYRGRINDLFEGPGRRRPSARTHDLRDALDAAFSGRRPDPDRTTAVGCILEPPA